MKMQKLAILAVAIAALSSGQGLSGRRAPSFALPDSSLKPYDILDYRGRWLVIDYMKTDRIASKSVTKELDQLKARLGAKVAILAIVLPPDNTATVAKYISETKTTTPILFDSSQSAMWYYKATPQKPSFDSPHLFAIDPKGMIVKDWNQADVDRGGYIPQLEALITGTTETKK